MATLDCEGELRVLGVVIPVDLKRKCLDSIRFLLIIANPHKLLIP